MDSSPRSQSKLLLDLMKSKYTPYLAVLNRRQSKLPIAGASLDGSGNQKEEEDSMYDDECDEDDGSEQQEQAGQSSVKAESQ